MKSKLLSLMLFALLGVAAASAAESIDGINYTLDATTRTATVATGNYTGDIVIPEKVTYNNREYTVTALAAGVFSEQSITSVVIPSTISVISSSAFYNCASLLKVTVPSTVKRIEELAFGDCTGLATVELNDGLEYIGNAAFGYCPKLTSITIPSTVTSMGDVVFFNSQYLKTIYWNAKNCRDFNSANESPFSKSRSSSVRAAKYNINSGYTDIYYNNTWTTSIIFGDEVEHIPAYLCYQFTGEVRNLTIPDNVKTIGDYAFYGCSNLVSLKLGVGLTEIGKYTFANCTKLTSLTIPDNVTTINQYAFNGCSGLTTLTLGANVETIGTYAFGGGGKIATINSYVVNPPYIDNTVFTYYSDLMVIDLNVRERALDAYEAANIWKDMHIGLVANDTRVFSLTVASADNAQGSTTSSGNYDEGDEVVIGAMPKDGFVFSRWNDGNIQNPRIVNMTGDLTYTAYFVAGSSTPTTNVYEVNIQGANCTMNINGQYPEGSVVKVEAVADDCLEFKQWSDGNKDNPRTITVSQNENLTAEFSTLTYTVTVQSGSTEGGSVEIKQ